MAERKSGRKTVITVILCVVAALVIAGGVLLYLQIEETNRINEYIMTNEVALNGVKVNGVEISGLKFDEAKAATAHIPDELLSKVKIAFEVEGEKFEFGAEELGVTTDYEAVILEALKFGHTGTLEERKADIAKAEEEGVEYTVKITFDKAGVEKALLPLKATLDKEPVNATFVFSPWGFLPDGTPYAEDVQKMIEGTSRNRMWKRPELMRIPNEQMPNKFRYEFWNEDHYQKDYIPADANVARFLYTEGVPGRSVDMDAVVAAAVAQIESGTYSLIQAPVTPIEPAVKVEDLKKKTQLVASWTSSYREHSGANRNWNVAKLSGIINGQILEPGVEWSINKVAGPRTNAAGWKDAPGIRNGGYVDEPGGGVCQISSTLYNAAIRSNIEVTDSTHHSISSNYIPLGLDATISTPSPDLKLKNNYDTPMYIVSYTNPKDKTVTVEIYGQPVVDPEFGEVILTFSFKDLGTFGEPKMNYIYNWNKETPDGKLLAPGESYEYAKARKGQKVQTYKHYLSPVDGKEVKPKENFHAYTWNPRNGTTYVNGPDPATLPSPTPDTSPTDGGSSS